MLSTEEKIKRLKELMIALGNTVSANKTRSHQGLCEIYVEITHYQSLGVDVPELREKRDRSNVFHARYWFCRSTTRYYLKRYRAIQETINELESKLENHGETK